MPASITIVNNPIGSTVSNHSKNQFHSANMAKVLKIFSVVVVVQLSSFINVAIAETVQEVYFKTNNASVTPIMTYELRTIKKFPDPIPADVEWPHLKQISKVLQNINAKNKDKPKQDMIARFQHTFEDAYRIAQLLSFPLSETSLELANKMKELISIDDFSSEDLAKFLRPARYLDHIKKIQTKVCDVVANTLLKNFDFEYLDILRLMPQILTTQIPPEVLKRLSATFQCISEDTAKRGNEIAKKVESVRKIMKKQMEISKNLNELMKRVKQIAIKLDNGKLKTEDKPKFLKALDELFVKVNDAIRIIRAKECRDAVAALEDEVLSFARSQLLTVDAFDSVL